MIKSLGILKESNEDLKVHRCEVEIFKVSVVFFFSLSFLYAQEGSLFWKWKKYDFFPQLKSG